MSNLDIIPYIQNSPSSNISDQMYSYFIVGNNNFCLFKKWAFAFFSEGTRGSQVLQNFEGGCS